MAKSMEPNLESSTPDAAEQAAPVLEFREGNTTFLVGIHFSETVKETLEDKIKKLIRKDVQDGTF